MKKEGIKKDLIYDLTSATKEFLDTGLIGEELDTVYGKFVQHYMPRTKLKKWYSIFDFLKALETKLEDINCIKQSDDLTIRTIREYPLIQNNYIHPVYLELLASYQNVFHLQENEILPILTYSRKERNREFYEYIRMDLLTNNPIMTEKRLDEIVQSIGEEHDALFMGAMGKQSNGLTLSALIKSFYQPYISDILSICPVCKYVEKKNKSNEYECINQCKLLSVTNSKLQSEKRQVKEAHYVLLEGMYRFITVPSLFEKSLKGKIEKLDWDVTYYPGIETLGDLVAKKNGQQVYIDCKTSKNAVFLFDQLKSDTKLTKSNSMIDYIVLPRKAFPIEQENKSYIKSVQELRELDENKFPKALVLFEDELIKLLKESV